MNKISSGITALLVVLSATSIAAVASEEAKKGVHAFKACYESSIPKGMTGAPVLNIKIVVDSKPEEKASGMGTVTWASVGPAFKPIESPIEGPWYYMCTMTSCSIRFDFSNAPGAKSLKGMLVAPNWGSPGTFKYEFEGGPGVVEQDAVVCK